MKRAGGGGDEEETWKRTDGPGSIPTDCTSRIATAYKYRERAGEKGERLIDGWIYDISIKKFSKDRNAYLICERHKSHCSEFK